jgi:hypothetical protein
MAQAIHGCSTSSPRQHRAARFSAASYWSVRQEIANLRIGKLHEAVAHATPASARACSGCPRTPARRILAPHSPHLPAPRSGTPRTSWWGCFRTTGQSPRVQRCHQASAGIGEHHGVQLCHGCAVQALP